MNFFASLFSGSDNQVSADEAVALYKEGHQLVDVREKSEWNSGHARGAIHIPLGQLENRTNRLHKHTPVLVICASGMRSRTGAKTLRDKGFQAVSVKGGMSAWMRAGGSIE
ncbi:MAG: rhodanese-like domain-containing protein [Actinomycetaceae bacterium]|nr:rhodanese-like domain-containing protein [Actinomycetaceae bacterium]